MVRSLRESLFGQIFLGAVVVAIILAFALTGRSGGPSVVSDCAIEVGKHCVPPKDFQAAYGLVTSIGINEKAAKSLNLKEQVALGLAEREVLLDRARQLGIGTSEADVDLELAQGRTRVSLPSRGAERLALSLALCVDGPAGCAPGTIGLRSIPVKKDGVFNYDRYKRTVRVATGRSPGHFKEAQQEELTAERVRDFYRAQVQVSEEEAYLAYRRARSEATARTLRVDSSWFARYVLELSAEEVESWAKENEPALKQALEAQKDGFQVGCPLVSELRLSLAADDGADTSVELEKLRAKVKAGQSFSETARRYSTAASASLGGRVGCLDGSYGPVSEVLLQGISEFKKAGELSSVITTVDGPTLLRVDGFVTAESRDQVRREFVARRLAVDAKSKELARSYAVAMITRLEAAEPMTDANDALLAEALAAGALKGQDNPGSTAENRPTTDISRPFSIERSPVTDAVGDVPVAKLVFDLAKPDDVVRQPIETQTGFAVLQLKEKDVASREDFAKDRERVMAGLRARKAEELLANAIGEWVERAGGMKLNRAFIPEEQDEDDAGSKPTGS